MAIVSLIIGTVSFIFLILPKLRQVQADRERILRLLVLMPKSVIYELVHRVYVTTNSEDEDVDKDEDEDDDEDEQNDEKENVETELQEITVVGNKSIAIYATFAAGLLVLALPPVVHAIYRFIDDQKLHTSVLLLKDLSTLYLTMNSLSWKSMDPYFECQNPAFCEQPFVNAVGQYEESIDLMEKYYDEVIGLIQQYPKMIGMFTDSQCFDTPNGLYRCIVEDSIYMPENFASKTHNGYSNLLQNFIRSSRKYTSKIMELYDINKNPRDVMKDTSVEPDFHYIYEIPLLEGEAGGYQAINTAKTIMEEQLTAGLLAANISYAVGLVCSFIIFIWIFGAIRKNILEETKKARGVLFMVPYETLRNTKAMIEYIENLYTAISNK